MLLMPPPLPLLTPPPLSLSLADLPVSLLVHNHVLTGPLQQLLLRLPPAGHRHGRQDAAHHPVVRHAQRQAGKSHWTAARRLLLLHLQLLLLLFFFFPLLCLLFPFDLCSCFTANAMSSLFPSSSISNLCFFHLLSPLLPSLPPTCPSRASFLTSSSAFSSSFLRFFFLLLHLFCLFFFLLIFSLPPHVLHL